MASIWLAATDRTAVTRAAAAIDRQLATDPLEAGESRPYGRIMFESPLAVRFKHDIHQRQVEVFQVWPIRRKTKP